MFVNQSQQKGKTNPDQTHIQAQVLIKVRNNTNNQSTFYPPITFLWDNFRLQHEMVKPLEKNQFILWKKLFVGQGCPTTKLYELDLLLKYQLRSKQFFIMFLCTVLHWFHHKEFNYLFSNMTGFKNYVFSYDTPVASFFSSV